MDRPTPITRQRLAVASIKIGNTMKSLLSIAFVALTLSAIACSSGTTGQQICDRVTTLCPASDGGSGITVSKCDATKADTASNKDDVKKCLDAAKDCSGAVACLLTAKQ
jgi:hypothetical protein